VSHKANIYRAIIIFSIIGNGSILPGQYKIIRIMANSGLLTTVWMFFISMAAILLPVWLGKLYGSYIRKKNGETGNESIGAAVGATLGLLAFMLGFAFQMVSNRFDKRKELMINEISDIRSTHMYAGLIPEPMRSNARRMIVEYVDIRVDFRRDVSKLQEAKSRSQQILDSLWSYSEALAAQDRSSEAYSLFTSSVNAMVNSFNQRITVVYQSRLPKGVLVVLVFVGILSMLMLGYQFGISGNVKLIVILLLGITFSAVLWLIFALDHPEAGLIKLNEAPLITLQEQLHRHTDIPAR
jgi:ABC-type multidrug transport system fused ATPase/permease subunit